MLVRGTKNESIVSTAPKRGPHHHRHHHHNHSPYVRPPHGPHRVVVHRPLALLPREDVPEPQRLIPGARDHRLTVGRYREVQHPQRVPRQRRQLGHRGIPPHDDLVLRVPVRADQLVDVLAPHQVTHLRAGVYAAQRGVRRGVPEADAPIRGASAGR